MEIKLRKFLGVEFVEEKSNENIRLIPNQMIIICHFGLNREIFNIEYIEFKSDNDFEISVYSNGDLGESYYIKNGKYCEYYYGQNHEYDFGEFKIFTSYVDYLKFKNKIELIR